MIRAARIVAAVLVVALSYASFNVWQVWQVGRSDESRVVDALVVLGAAQYDGRPSPQLQGRLDHALQSWRDGLAPLIIVTGGKLQEDRFTEAEASAKFFTDAGVPTAAIALENTGHTTRESLLGVREILRSRGLHRILIVTDPYHALRARLIAQDLGLRAFVSPTRTSPIKGSDDLARHFREGAGVALGHVIGFAQLERFTR